MTPEFADLLSATITDLTGDLLFTYKPDDTLIAPQIIETAFPAKDHEYEEGQEFPFVRWAIYRGGFDARRPAPFSVAVVGGIYTAGNIIDGTRGITSLTMALGRIVDKLGFPPYKLRVPVEFEIGNLERGFEGLQPHPYYYTTMQLQFLVPGTARR